MSPEMLHRYLGSFSVGGRNVVKRPDKSPLVEFDNLSTGAIFVNDKSKTVEYTWAEEQMTHRNPDQVIGAGLLSSRRLAV